MLLTDAMCAILSLFKIRASPIRLSEHNVSCRREGDALACRLDVTNEEPTVGIVLEFLNGSVTIPQRRASGESNTRVLPVDPFKYSITAGGLFMPTWRRT
jgi:hypothetical protein